MQYIDQGTADTSPHYNQLGTEQPILIMLKHFTTEEMQGFLRGNVIKYTARAGLKAGTDDRAKAVQYQEWYYTYTKHGFITINDVDYYKGV